MFSLGGRWHHLERQIISTIFQKQGLGFNFKVSRKKIEDSPCELRLGTNFLTTMSKAQSIKEQIGTLNILKIKTSYSLKDTFRRIKSEVIEWGKIFVNHISDKGLETRVCKDVSKLNNKKPNYSIKKRAKDLKGDFT